MAFKTVTDQRNAINILSMYGKLPEKKVETTQSETLVKAVIGKTRSGKEVYNMTDESYENFTKVDHKFATELCKAQNLVEEVEYHKERYNELQKSEAYNGLKDQFDMLIKSEVIDELEKAEGDHGGKVIGHTISGKPIYENQSAHDYVGFSKEDHEGGALHHQREADKHNKGTKKNIWHEAKAHGHKERYNELQKSEAYNGLKDQFDMLIKAEDDLEKGGEGSRGGKVIGHTSTGKPIYDNADNPAHKSFGTNEHFQAAQLHKDLEKHWDSKIPKSDGTGFGDRRARASVANEKANHHFDQANKHEESMRSVANGGSREIGKTQSGKSIMNDPHHEDHKDFTKQDHIDATKVNRDIGNKERSSKALDRADAHRELAKTAKN